MAIRQPISGTYDNRGYKVCSWCYQSDHTAIDCQRLDTAVGNGLMRAIKYKKKLNGSTGRLCGYCADEGHVSNNCPKRYNDAKALVLSEKEISDKAFAWLKEIGFGPGAMLSGMAREKGWNSRGKSERIVIIEEFKNDAVASHFFANLLRGSDRNWYNVTAVDSTNETVRNIYLPFHPTFAPKPTSVNVQVIHKANEEDIEKYKKYLPALSSPLLDYNNAEEFFQDGYRFKNGTTKNPEIIKIHN